VHPEGSAAAWKSKPVQAAIAAGRPVMAIDAFQTGSAVAVRDRSHRYFLTFNKSDDANRVQDILTALAFLRSQGSAKAELKGTGSAGIWSLFARDPTGRRARCSDADYREVPHAGREVSRRRFEYESKDSRSLPRRRFDGCAVARAEPL